MNEARFLGRELELRADGDKPTRIVGYAAVYYRDGDPGTEYELWPARGGTPRAVERIMPGAFDKAIKDDDVVALFNHQDDKVLGRSTAGTLRLFSDAEGLRYEIDADDTTIFEDVQKLIAKRNVRGSSFRFRIRGEDHWNFSSNLEVRELRDLELFDVGPVTFPAYKATSVNARSSRDSLAEQVAEEAARIAKEHLERELWLRERILARIA